MQLGHAEIPKAFFVGGMAQTKDTSRGWVDMYFRKNMRSSSRDFDLDFSNSNVNCQTDLS